jgi:hypothetical protein
VLGGALGGAFAYILWLLGKRVYILPVNGNIGRSVYMNQLYLSTALTHELLLSSPSPILICLMMGHLTIHVRAQYFRWLCDPTKPISTLLINTITWDVPVGTARGRVLVRWRGPSVEAEDKGDDVVDGG